MSAVESSGTQTATIGTEHTLASPTTMKVRVLIVDTANLANGDTLELRIKQKVLTGGSEGLAYFATYANAQGELIKHSPPVIMPFGGDVTLKQTAGTGRSFDWSLCTLD